MLKNVKLFFFNKKLFSYIGENRKLEIIRYNKYLQKNININIINYLHLADRYIIYESKGVGKEYIRERNKLIYEGQFLHTKRNGKGKEYYYDADLLQFEGEYLNGKRWSGTGYDYIGNISFQLNNSINGNVKEFNYKGDLIFEGKYLNGKRNGKGKEYDVNSDLLIFEDEY